MRLYLDKVFFVDVMYKKNMVDDPSDIRFLRPSATFKIPDEEPKLLTKQTKLPHENTKIKKNLLNTCQTSMYRRNLTSDCTVNGTPITTLNLAQEKLAENLDNPNFINTYSQTAGKRRRRRTTRRRKSSKASKKSRRRRRSHKRRR
jgi:hypothetical protein